MFCSNCGKELKEGARFCTGCGTAVAAESANQETVAQAPVAQETVVQAPVYQAPVIQEPVTQSPVNQAVYESAQQTNTYTAAPAGQEGFTLRSTYEKKPKKKNTALLIVAAVAVVAVVLVVLNFNAIMGLFQRNSSPEAQLKSVEKEAVASLAESVSQIYGDILEGTQGEATGGQSEIHLVLSDEVLANVQNMLAMEGMDLDVSWLSDILLSGETKIDGDLYEAKIGIGLGDVQLLSVHVYMDMANGEIYMGIPEVSDQYLMVSQAALANGGMAISGDMAISGSMGTMYLGDIAEFLPSADVVEQLLNKYAGLVLDSIEKVEKSEQTLTAGGLEQTATELKVVLREKDLAKMVLAVLKEAKNDTMIRDIIEDGEDYVRDMGVTIAGDLYKGFQNAVQELIDDLEDQEFDEDGESIELYVYLDGSNQIIGRKIESEDMDIEDIYYQIVTEGNAFAFETRITDLEIVGEGERSGNLCSGMFEIAYEGDVYLEVEFEDFDEKKLVENILCGTKRLRLGSGMEDLLADQMGSSMLLSAFGVELVFDNSDSEANMEIKLMVDESMVLGLYVNSLIKEGGKVVLPSDVLEFYGDEETAMEWVSSFDFDAILDNLSKTDIPNEYLDIISYYISELEYLFY